MNVREITDTTTLTVKIHTGNDPYIIIGPQGQHIASGTTRADKVRTVTCPPGCRILIGTEAEIAAEKATASAKSDELLAARKAARAATDEIVK
jgi:hypothetical protein